MRGIVLSFALGLAIIFQWCCKTPPFPPPPPHTARLSEDFESTHRLMNDIFSRAQRGKDSDTLYSVRSAEDFRRYYPDLVSADASVRRARYVLLFDWDWQHESQEELLPPIIAAPVDMMRELPNHKYPVLMLRPEDNPGNALISRLRLAFLSAQQIEPFMRQGQNFDYGALQESYQFLKDHAPNYWPYYCQDRVRDYFIKMAE